MSISKATAIDQIGKECCCGCGACEAVCPINAVKMELDYDGFYYPTIDLERCADCGLCIRACIAHQNI